MSKDKISKPQKPKEKPKPKEPQKPNFITYVKRSFSFKDLKKK